MAPTTPGPFTSVVAPEGGGGGGGGGGLVSLTGCVMGGSLLVLCARLLEQEWWVPSAFTKTHARVSIWTVPLTLRFSNRTVYE